MPNRLSIRATLPENTYPAVTAAVAQVMPPAAFQMKNVRHGMCVMPAIQAPKMRRPAVHRARNTVLPPWLAKNRSPQPSMESTRP